MPSHPSRVCGLKWLPDQHIAGGAVVTPFTGVWIEIPGQGSARRSSAVTPFTGVWIEIPIRN